jgi:hypothetical protein
MGGQEMMAPASPEMGMPAMAVGGAYYYAQKGIQTPPTSRMDSLGTFLQSNYDAGSVRDFIDKRGYTPNEINTYLDSTYGVNPGLTQNDLQFNSSFDSYLGSGNDWSKAMYNINPQLRKDLESISRKSRGGMYRAQTGGVYEDMELTDAQIEDLRRQGYDIEIL